MKPLRQRPVWPHLPTDIRAANLRSRASYRSNIRAVSADLVLRHDGARGAAESRAVAAVSIVRNEDDIIGDVIEHLFEQGVSRVVVVDHGSTDDTPQILEDLARNHPLTVYSLGVPGFYQEETVGLLAAVARERGARWIIPFDADEFWFAEDRSLRDFLGAQRCRTVEATGNHLFVPSGGSVDGAGRIAHDAELDLGTVGYRKIAFRASRNVFVYHGNHEVERRGDRGTGLYIAHAPIRTLEQLRRKVRNGAAAMKAAGSRRGKHWKHLAKLSDADLETYWETVRERQEWGKVGWVPRGPLQRVSVRSARTWTEVLAAGPPGTREGS